MITEKKIILGKSSRDSRAPEGFSDKVMPDVDYFTDEPRVSEMFQL